MTLLTQDVPVLAAQELCGLVTRRPRHDVVVYSGQDICVDVYMAWFETTVDSEFTSGKFVAQITRAQILRVHPCRHPGRAFVPGQQTGTASLVVTLAEVTRPKLLGPRAISHLDEVHQDLMFLLGASDSSFIG